MKDKTKEPQQELPSGAFLPPGAPLEPVDVGPAALAELLAVLDGLTPPGRTDDTKETP
jgi:hypothetical protein